MGRFSKLETGSKARAQQRPDAGVADGKASPGSGPAVQYDHVYYQGEAERLFFTGNYQKALQLYSRAVQSDRAQINPWVGQVQCLIEMKQYKEAMIWVKRSLELFPEEARLISLQGMIYAQQGMVQRGLQCSDYALQKSAADALVWVLRGEVLTLAGNKNAEFCFTKAMETKLPDDWTIPAQVGMFLLREKHHAPAVEYLKAGVHLNTRNDFLWLNLGLALERLGIVQPALDAFNTALKLNPQNVEAEHAVRRLTSAPFLARFLRRFFG